VLAVLCSRGLTQPARRLQWGRSFDVAREGEGQQISKAGGLLFAPLMLLHRAGCAAVLLQSNRGYPRGSPSMRANSAECAVGVDTLRCKAEYELAQGAVVVYVR
jgi:hypothetical protein